MFQEYNDILSVSDICEILLIGRNRTYELLNNAWIPGWQNLAYSQEEP